MQRVAFLAAEHLLDLPKLWARIEDAHVPEAVRIELFQVAARSVRSHVSDILRSTGAEDSVADLVDLLKPAMRTIAAATTKLIRSEVRNEALARREHLLSLGADSGIVDGLVRIFELDGVFGISALAAKRALDAQALTEAYTKLGETLGLDWAQSIAAVMSPSDPWERLLVAGLARDFQQMRFTFLRSLARRNQGKGELLGMIAQWADEHAPQIGQFRAMIGRAQGSAPVAPAMLAQIASQARNVLHK